MEVSHGGRCRESLGETGFDLTEYRQRDSRQVF